MPQAAEPEEPMHVLERVRRPDGSLPVAYASDHSPLGKTHSMTRVILGKSRVRESRMPGSVRAKAEWLSYPTTARRNREAAARLAQVPSGFVGGVPHASLVRSSLQQCMFRGRFPIDEAPCWLRVGL
jgi:hypothetical protein